MAYSLSDLLGSSGFKTIKNPNTYIWDALGTGLANYLNNQTIKEYIDKLKDNYDKTQAANIFNNVQNPYIQGILNAKQTYAQGDKENAMKQADQNRKMLINSLQSMGVNNASDIVNKMFGANVDLDTATQNYQNLLKQYPLQGNPYVLKTWGIN